MPDFRVHCAPPAAGAAEITLSPAETQRIGSADPSAVCISAREGSGVDDLLEAVASRLALDALRVTLTFDPDAEADQERLRRVYRHGRVVEHEVRDGRVAIVADVPRRLLGWLQPPAR